MDAQSFKYIVAACMAIGMAGAAIGVANIFSALLNAISRNPNAEGKLVKQALIGAGMAEAMGVFALVVIFIIIFVVK